MNVKDYFSFFFCHIKYERILLAGVDIEKRMFFLSKEKESLYVKNINQQGIS
jgi:hypothetical protein